MKNENVKLLCDLNAQTDKTIKVKQPELILIDKVADNNMQ